MKNIKFWIEKECEVCNKKFWSLIKRNQRFCCNKCSTLYTANDKNRIDKIKQTKFKKYGDINFVNSEKAKQTCLNKYGVDNVSKLDIIKEKIKEKNNKKYGVDWIFQSEKIKEKIKKKIYSLYGVENISQSDLVKNEKKQKSILKYGVDNVSKSKEVIDKIKNTNLIKYGYTCPLKNEEIKTDVTNKIKRFNYNRIKNRLNNHVNFLFTEDEYINTNKENLYQFKCLKCNEIFKDNIDGGHIPRCLKCYPYIQGFSIFEKEIVSFIKSILPNEIIIEKNRNIIGKELDIYIPSKNIAIEFDGLYWHSENGGKKDKNYHKNKTLLCKDNDIRLIHIFEDEWIDKSEIVKNRLKHLLLKENSKLYARDCIVKNVSTEECNEFLNKYHLQGCNNSNIKIGLYYKDNLVSIMTFGDLRVVLGSKRKENEYEMYRFCSSCNVIGAGSKLFSYFIKEYNPIKVISYADKRWSNNQSFYSKLGFNLIGETTPNYWYFKPGIHYRYHRFSFRKSELIKKLDKFDNNLTEWENMQLNGYDRIWDCGNLKYEWSKY